MMSNREIRPISDGHGGFVDASQGFPIIFGDPEKRREAEDALAAGEQYVIHLGVSSILVDHIEEGLTSELDTPTSIALLRRLRAEYSDDDSFMVHVVQTFGDKAFEVLAAEASA
jgi:hypothetical protein